MAAIEDSADRVDEATSGGVQKKAREADLMTKVEAVRDGLDQAVAGDKQALSQVFAANGCERIGRLRLVIDTVQMEMYKQDPRWQHLVGVCRTIESVLRDLGTFRKWRPDKEQVALSKRQMMRELQKKQRGENAEDSPEEDLPPPAAAAPGKVKNMLPEDFKLPAMYQATPLDPPAPAPVPVAAPEPEPALSTGYPVKEEPQASKKKEDPLASNLMSRGIMIGSGPGSADPDEEITDPNAMRADTAPGGGGGPTARHRFTRPDSHLEGWVWKKSRFLKRWRRRWLVLGPGQLGSFRQRGDPEPTETVSKGTILRVHDADAELGQSKSFCVVQRSRSYFMVCDDAESRNIWVSKIQEVLR
jgi:hypothetical protein